ncbi:uncharacterized protein BCR38DRAFT_442239 [Pseudomassariella vexata]|uniref:Uncharacterized protein n=1 Tax=Pseudomassariella vexata TaxID=1141098 RepID=A0A1Y2DN66_9PEZI|nr:uncharacterized protein BCR38DRAFT_442239 [Pseudomassariella vexata]ORY60701.1 hypothetical protein BCR38DRAFT_442239 [Pseudomassariella vexata]
MRASLGSPCRSNTTRLLWALAEVGPEPFNRPALAFITHAISGPPPMSHHELNSLTTTKYPTRHKNHMSASTVRQHNSLSLAVQHVGTAARNTVPSSTLYTSR